MPEYEKLSDTSRFTHLKVEVVAGDEIVALFVYLRHGCRDRLSAPEAEDLRLDLFNTVKDQLA